MTLALAALASACKEDYFDAESYNAQVQAAFPVKNIDPEHTWSTVGQAFVRITVNKKAGETFRMRIYDQNPIATHDGLSILLDGKIKDGTTFTGTLSHALATDVVYVALFDSEGYMSVYPQGIIDSKVELTIGGSETAAARTMGQKAPGRAIEHQYDFEELPQDTAFHTTVPDGAVDISRYGEFGKQTVWWPEYKETPAQFQTFYVDPQSGNRHLQIDHGLADIYLKAGTHRLSCYVLGSVRIYLLPGARVTFENELNQNNFGLKMYVCEGATLTCPSGISYNFRLYNRGTITTSQMTQYAAGVLVNQGTVSIANTLQIANAASQVVNAGVLSCSKLSVEGSSHFLNLDTMLVSGETSLSSNNLTWVNSGEYTTHDFRYTAGSTDVINKCHLTVNNLFYIGLGDTSVNGFQMDGGSSVQARTFQFSGPGYIRMGSGAVFSVTEKAQFAINKDGYGIYGPSTGGYAVFQSPTIERLNAWETNQGFSANYFGHLYVATDNHFAFGYSDKSTQQQAAGEVGAQPYYRLDAASGAQMVGYGKADVHTGDNGCGAAYDGEPQAEAPQAASLAYRYCFEDNFPMPGDYDFNDAVITVTPITDGTSTVTLRVSLDAVGASEQIAAGLRIKGLSPSDVVSCTRDVTPDEGLPYSNNFSRYFHTEEVMVPQELKTSQAQNDVVLVLFNNAHWTLGQELTTTGVVNSCFINTVPTTNDYEPKRNGVQPYTMNFTFVLSDEAMAANFAQSHLDPFIVQSYNGGFWEVHPVPYKFDEVLSEYYKNLRADYDDSDKKPWAICVVGNFKYPIEWKPISEAYNTPGHSFEEWATDRTQATDWYEHPNEEMVY